MLNSFLNLQELQDLCLIHILSKKLELFKCKHFNTDSLVKKITRVYQNNYNLTKIRLVVWMLEPTFWIIYHESTFGGQMPGEWVVFKIVEEPKD